MEKRKKTVQVPDEPPRHDAVPLAVWAGGEDDDVDADLEKLLAAQGFSAPRGFRIRLWPPWP
jgi:hypothetical protein